MTEEQKISYEMSGFLTIPGALAGEELEGVREAADKAEALWRDGFVAARRAVAGFRPDSGSD